ncbi:MAG: class I SAM-dependent methyltransferase [bacterium]|jgi:SAM-dependent methyltransferase
MNEPQKFRNVYDDKKRAEAYAKLEFPGTYYLAYRDLPSLIARNARGKRALDFGCGTGRSSRFLKNLGFDVTGIDISASMIAKARELDPGGNYSLVPDSESGLQSLDLEVDLVLSAFTFDNIPTREKKIALFKGLGGILSHKGCLVNLVSSPEIYRHEWVSFSTKDFPENRQARSGDRVKIIITAVDDSRPVEDIVWEDADYRQVYQEAGLEIVEIHSPLGLKEEPYPWVNETEIAPWVIYILRRAN